MQARSVLLSLACLMTANGGLVVSAADPCENNSFCKYKENSVVTHYGYFLNGEFINCQKEKVDVDRSRLEGKSGDCSGESGPSDQSAIIISEPIADGQVKVDVLIGPNGFVGQSFKVQAAVLRENNVSMTGVQDLNSQTFNSVAPNLTPQISPGVTGQTKVDIKP